MISLPQLLMAKEPFIQPRFVGPRFDEHTLPLSAAKDLAAYEELVVELAKQLYLNKHQGNRQRVPKGFAEGFHLHLEKVDEGSAMPLLALVMAGALVNPLPIEFSEAKTLINEVIATPDGDKLPPAFPKELYSYFNRIGRSLEPGERLEWTPGNPTNPSALTPAKRKRLALAVGATYEAEVDIVGQIFSLNTKKSEGQLLTGENEQVSFDYDQSFLDELKKALGNCILYAHLQGVGVFDVNDRLKSIKEIEYLDIVPHYALVSAIDDLSNLKDGWLEGRGVAPDRLKLERLSDDLVEVFPPGIDYPAVVPTEDGNVSLEWIKPAARVELEVNFAENRLELYATDIETDTFVEKSFDMADWSGAFGQVTTLLG
jgi:hypothetical protein